MENGLASYKVSLGYCISGQGLVQMQSGKSTIWKSCLPAAFYSSLIFGLTQDTGRTLVLAFRPGLGSERILHKDISRQQCGPELDKNETAAPAELGSICSKSGMATAASSDGHFWVIFPTPTLSLTASTSWRPCPGWALPLSHRGHWAQMSSSDSRPRLKTAPRPQSSCLWLPVTCQVTWEVLHVF